MKRASGLAGLALLALLSACAGDGGPGSRRPVVGPPVPRALAAGLDRVLGQDAGTLQALFGIPNLDIREGSARKLQFTSSVCVLDTYLYPPATGREPVVRHIDARLPSGEDFDRASCVAALSRRKEAR